jgi:hypothetical protein
MKQTTVIVAAFAAGLLGGIVGALVTRSTSQSHPDQVVRAHSFELLDENGKVISFWGIDKTQYAVLAFASRWPKDYENHPIGPLTDPDNQRAAFGIIDDGAFLFMKGADGKKRISLGLSIWEKPLLWMGDGRSKRLSLGIEHSDTPNAHDNNWFLRIEPDLASIGMIAGTEPNGQGYVQGVFHVNKDRVPYPY